MNWGRNGHKVRPKRHHNYVLDSCPLLVYFEVAHDVMIVVLFTYECRQYVMSCVFADCKDRELYYSNNRYFAVDCYLVVLQIVQW